MFIWGYIDELEFKMTKETLRTVLENSVKKTMYKVSLVIGPNWYI